MLISKYQDDGEFSITHPLVPYDFDGHGAGGVYFLVEANHPEGPGGASPELLTVRGSALVKIEHSFGELRDEDGDGRLDGIAPTSSSPWYCPDYVQYDLAGPSLLYRGLARDGFTLHDAIARSFVTKQCPAPRRPFRLARNETLTRQGSHAAKCAHLHGVPSGEIERGLLAWCKAHPDPRCSRDCCEPSCTTLVTAILRDLERIPKLLAPVADAGASASQ